MAQKRKKAGEPIIMNQTEFERRVKAGYKLSDNVIVRGTVNLARCTNLTSLPNNLLVCGCLILSGCTSLTSLPDKLIVKRSLIFHGCTGFEKPKFVSADRYYTDSIFVYRDEKSVEIKFLLPEIVISQLPGRRIEEVVDHWMLDVSGIRGRTIVSARSEENFISIILD